MKRTLEEGLHKEREKWTRWHRHECSKQWKAWEVEEGGAESAGDKAWCIANLSELVAVQKQLIAGLEDQLASPFLGMTHT